MLHLPNNTALRKLTLCISVVEKGLSRSFPSHKSHPSGWVLAMFMDSLTSGVGTFPGNTSKTGSTGDSTCARESQSCSADGAWQGAGRHVTSVRSQDAATRRQLEADELFRYGVSGLAVTVLELIIALSFRGPETIPLLSTAIH